MVRPPNLPQIFRRPRVRPDDPATLVARAFEYDLKDLVWDLNRLSQLHPHASQAMVLELRKQASFVPAGVVARHIFGGYTAPGAVPDADSGS